MPGLLAGLRIIDLSRGLAGPLCTMLLADHGAEVIRVEPPGGDPFRHDPAQHALNRGKRSVILDLKTPRGRADLRLLCRGADALLESFRPGVAERLGIAALAAELPHLVQVSLAGFPAAEPGVADIQGYEHLIDAWMGLMDEQPGFREGPIFNAFPIASYGGAFLAAIGLLAALHARDITGRGQRVDTSMVDGVVLLSTMFWHWSERNCDGANPVKTMGRLTRRHLFLLGMMQCADGKYLQIHTGPVGRFGRALELLGLADAISRTEPGREKSTPLAPEEAALLMREIPRILKTRPRAEWLALFERADIACLPVDPPGVAMSDPQVLHDGIPQLLEDPDLGTLKLIGPVLKVPDAPARIRGPAPRAGADTEAVLAEAAGWETPALPATPAPLSHPMQGIRIVDFGAFFAGPYAAKLLGDLGAEVIKVEPTSGDAMRGSHGPFRGAQRGKRCIALDMKSAEGQAIAHRLIERADIVCHNMRPGAAERLALDYATVRGVKPDIIYLYAPGFSATGPRSHLQAFATMLSAMCGFQWAAGGEGNPPTGSLANEDYLNGALGAVAMLMGLAWRRRTGRGIAMEGSLLNSVLFATSDILIGPDDRPLFPRPLDQAQMGFGPLCRLYRTADGFICLVVAQPHEWQALTRVPGLAALAGNPDFADRPGRAAHAAALAGVLEEFFARHASAAAEAMLRGAGVPCMIPRRTQITDYFLDDARLARGAVVEYRHPDYGRMREVGQGVRFSAMDGLIRGPAPLLGEHTRPILHDLGYDDAAITALRQRGVVAWAEHQMAAE